MNRRLRFFIPDADAGFNQIMRPGLNLFINFGDVFADNAQANHNKATYQQHADYDSGVA